VADRTRRGAELTIFGAVSAACILTTHSVVAILATGQVARELGEAHDITRTRRANILDVAVCTYPFLLPFFIPTILASATTLSGEEAGMPHITAFDAGLHNFHSFGLLVVLVVSIVVGRRR
jgi:Na+/H+ antiporter NhaC